MVIGEELCPDYVFVNSEPSSGAGTYQTWLVPKLADDNGDLVDRRVEITVASQNKSVECVMVSPRAVHSISTGKIELTQRGECTKVTWSTHSNLRRSEIPRYWIPSLQSDVHDKFAQGLSNLKVVVEQQGNVN